ncbi:MULTISPECIES: hypothetical protein [unclassified Mesorhizobium]|uniref:hypothetical protein n=1 Tax=unclassified Mesorhizobium TaxID=325217 RepID=UPI001128B6C3|nr:MULTISPECIES: hypothetical protein [unclassified Mesorhizobium]MBZ9700750.1 hypothetical protein [Mesorhizobium sp. CO1-1-3]MBZ9946686.1 hypothetical protein [Mesorhizobium sp. BR1-1-11]TPJ04651.1 hypothetical protein FJ428_15095 [Mesorhizobium sp. B2-8-1]TPJ54032.1 hypothetical protein FJ426_10270 [Mesorhizobium sp. B2-6-4]TPM93318.1 hypothetical protein FJ966_20600 [Mesorhizobium sp. B2-1-5]
MRQVLTSFLALHWTIVFALLAIICIDGNRGVAGALGVLGVTIESARFVDLENVVVVAPLATALLVVAVLFFWAFVEALINNASNPGADSVARIAFISASGVLSLILVGGAAQGINGLFLVVAVQLAALLASYVAMLAERRTLAASDEVEIHATAHSMARAAAHNSLLSLISGRPQPTRKGGR